MSDLISRTDLIGHLNACLAESDGRTPLTDAVLMAVKCAVEQMPTIDAVEVVRCKDCKHNLTHNCRLYYGTTNFNDFFVDLGEDFYCADGERKEVSEDV